jgi:hypothetical protein
MMHHTAGSAQVGLKLKKRHNTATNLHKHVGMIGIRHRSRIELRLACSAMWDKKNTAEQQLIRYVESLTSAGISETYPQE